jgi:hypothetical protein
MNDEGEGPTGAESKEGDDVMELTAEDILGAKDIVEERKVARVHPADRSGGDVRPWRAIFGTRMQAQGGSNLPNLRPPY